MSRDLKAMVGNDNKARFSHYRDGNFFYVVEVQGKPYSFPIPIEDAKGSRIAVRRHGLQVKFLWPIQLLR